MFTMKYEPKQWMMTVRFNTGGGTESTQRSFDESFDVIHIEKYGPFDTQEEAWMLYYTLKAEDEYSTIRSHPYFEQIATPPSISVKQKLAAARYVHRNPHLEYWKPQRQPFPKETEKEHEHRIEMSDYLLIQAAKDVLEQHDADDQPVYGSGGGSWMASNSIARCGCNACYAREYKQWKRSVNGW